MTSSPLHKTSVLASFLKTLGLLVAVSLAIFSLVGPVLNWPHMDEANYLLQARNIAQGLLPYRDFFEFITPGGQFLAGLWSRLNGFSIVSLRLWVIIGWLVELLLITVMAKGQIKQPWLGLLIAFVALTDLRYPVFQHHFGSGLLALLSVYMAWRSIEIFYQPRQSSSKGQYFLLGCGLLTGLTFWFTQSLGILLTLALGGFSILQCFLHEREEKGLTYSEVSNKLVWLRWVKTWGVAWLLPLLSVHVSAVVLLACSGLLPAFLRDTFGWLGGGNYSQTTVFGYFVTFHQEFLETIKPLTQGVPMPYTALFWCRVPIALHLFLIGALPVVGLLGVGYALPQRFLYRLLRQEDEELLLWWFAALAMMLSTFSYSTSMHIVSNGVLFFLLAAWAIQAWMSRYSSEIRWSKTRWIIGGFAIWGSLTLLGGVIGSAMILLWGSWLPAFPGLNERLIYTETSPNALQFTQVANLLQQAKNAQQTVFIYNESPSLYLTGNVRNATRYTIILPHYTSQRQLQEILNDLKQKQPLYIVYDQAERTLQSDPRFARYLASTLHLPEIERYIQAYYQPYLQAGRLIVFKRKTI